MKFYRITSKWFVAGLETDDRGRITKSAPILRQFLGWDMSAFKRAAGHAHWKIEALDQPENDDLALL